MIKTTKQQNNASAALNAPHNLPLAAVSSATDGLLYPWRYVNSCTAGGAT
jgi:hypothetical protein